MIEKEVISAWAYLMKQYPSKYKIYYKEGVLRTEICLPLVCMPFGTSLTGWVSCDPRTCIRKVRMVYPRNF